MSNTIALRLMAFAALALFSTQLWAPPRSIRIDNSDNWNQNAIGSGACKGTAASSILVTSLNYTFSGRASTGTENYSTNDYCELSVPGTLSTDGYSHEDEPGLRTLFGTGNGISGIRYDFLDNLQAFSADGFQWGFYTFPSGNAPVTLVGLYGLDGSVNGIGPNSTSFIKQGSTSVWSGSSGYAGQYFCFQNNVYIGSWDGNVSDTNSACLKAVGVLFINGFDAAD